MNLKTVWERRQTDAAFTKAELQAMDVAKDAIEAEITQRAMEGVREIRRDGKSGVVIQQRQVCSDMLLLALAWKAETGSWRDSRKVELTGNVTTGTMTRAERMAKLAEAEKAGRAALSPCDDDSELSCGTRYPRRRQPGSRRCPLRARRRSAGFSQC